MVLEGPAPPLVSPALQPLQRREALSQARRQVGQRRRFVRQDLLGLLDQQRQLLL